MQKIAIFTFWILSLIGPGWLTGQNRFNQIPGDFLVQLAPDTDPNQIARDFGIFNGHEIRMQPVREVSPPLHIWLYHHDAPNQLDRPLLQALQQHPGIRVAQYNHLIEDRDSLPDDPFLPDQWQWINTGASGGLEDADVDAELAWDIATGGLTTDGDTIVVCVVDDGTDLDHPDLAPNLWINFGEIPDDNIDNDDNGYIDDYYGWNINALNDNVGSGAHGVRVNGMVGAAGNNAVGGTGINWHVQIMTVRRGSSNEADAIEAYTYPLVMRQKYNQTNGQSGAFVVAVNSSWGTDFGQAEDAPLWCAFYDTLGAYGILSCAATANLDINVDEEGDLPTACPSDFLIAVTASDDQDQRNFSAYGLEHIDLAAPGESIYTTTNGEGYTYTSGTSFASPLVAGLIALLYSAPCSQLITLAKNDPPAAALLVKNYILSGTDPIPGLAGFILTGGRANAHNSLSLLMENCGPCPPPYALSYSTVADTALILSWATPAETDSIVVQWRESGLVAWNPISGAVSPLELTGLSGCTNYEIQVIGYCGDSLQSPGSIAVVTTGGCCLAPASFTATALSANSLVCTWSQVNNAAAFEVQLSPAGEENWTSVTIGADIPEQFYVFQPLLPCTWYDARIRTICENDTSEWAAQLVQTIGCGTCLDADYCASYGESQTFEYIAYVSLHTLENATTAETAGYGQYTGLSTGLIAGNTYALLLAPGFEQNPYPENFRVWIDYDQNGEFSDANELVWNEGLTNMAYSHAITIPATAVTGSTRMRVSMKYLGSFNPAQTPCEVIAFGETEDYCIQIAPGNDCPQVLIPDTAIVSAETVQINWPMQSASTAYKVRYQSEALEGWTYIDNAVSPLVLEGLEPCHTYFLQVQSFCDTIASGYGPGLSFTTDCIDQVNEIYTGQDQIRVYPNPFRQQVQIELLSAQSAQAQVTLDHVSGIRMASATFPYSQGAGSPYSLELPANAPSGWYILRIQTRDTLFTERLLYLPH